jgi:hypothetical protein
MKIDRRELGRHYASLSNEELLSLDRSELSETAQVIYDLEIKRRCLSEKPLDLEKPEVFVGSIEGPAPDWLEDAVLACCFDVSHGDENVARAADEKAARALAVLHAAGIPSRIEVTREEAGHRSSASETLNVMVPLGLALHAAGVLDRDLLNEEYEAEWRAHLKMLSDKNLSMLNPEIFCAGLQDRLTRIKKAYAEEIAARNMQA